MTKKRNLILAILATFAYHGCTLEAPLNLGVKCSDDEHGLSAIVQANTICHPEDALKDKTANCVQYADAFRYGHCPENYFCIEDQDGIPNICSVNQCYMSQHEYNGGCEENSLRHCASHGYACDDNIPGWVSGNCISDYAGAHCFATECEIGYELDKVSGQCTALVDCPTGKHIYMGECEDDSVLHCGRHGYACAMQTAGWVDGACEDSVCVPSNCDVGYRLEDKSCHALINCGDNEHIYNGVCEPDSITNCGMHANDCRLRDGWADGNCTDAHCFASACAKGYEIRDSSGACLPVTLNCLQNQHIVGGECFDDTLEACGSETNDCTRMAGWVAGECENKTCVASECAVGYELDAQSGVCIALLSCDDDNHVSNGECVPDTVSACGSDNNDCSKMAGWDDGYCVNKACVAATCTTGYIQKEGQCVALMACGQGMHYFDGTCEQDTIEHCGVSRTNCTKLDGWKDGTCQDGKCEASSCQSGFCLDGKQCVNGSMNALSCGSLGGTSACVQCGIKEACFEGSCVISGCDQNTCFYQGMECSNTSSHCGRACLDCNSANHASAGTCSSNGTCTITACAVGYHLKNAECIQDTDTACGKDSKNCMIEGNALSGKCTVDGTCIALACQPGFHLFEGKCEENSDENCGSHGHACDIEQNYLCQTEIGTCACPEGYIEKNQRCVSNVIICDEDNYANVNVDPELCDQFLRLNKDEDLIDYPCSESGTVQAYCLNSVEDFYLLKETLDAGTATNSSVLYYVLDRDIDFGVVEDWTPIKTSNLDSKVPVVLFGNYHKISGDFHCTEEKCGLYDEMNHAIINHLDLNINIHASGSVGTLASSISRSLLDDVRVEGDVTSETRMAGGIATEFTQGIMSNCTFTGNIQTDMSLSFEELNNALDSPGAGGMAWGAHAAIFRNCAVNGHLQGASLCGGIVGMGWGDVHIYDAVVKADIESIFYGGGIVAAHIESSVHRSQFDGSMHGSLLGGIVGVAQDVFIDQSVAKGTLTSDVPFPESIGDVPNDQYGIGGLVGTAYSYSNESLQLNSSVFYGAITSVNTNVGGIIGSIVGGGGSESGSAEVTINQCGAFGTIQGEEKIQKAGGIVGSAMLSDIDFSIKSSFSAVDIKNVENGAQIGNIANVKLYDVYTTGGFEEVDRSSSDILDGSYDPSTTPVFYYWYSDATENHFPDQKFTYIEDRQYVSDSASSELVNALNDGYHEYNPVSDAWELRYCTLKSGPAAGEDNTYLISVPKSMPLISACKPFIEL